jgi:ParB family chromosome partitioning protein
VSKSKDSVNKKRKSILLIMEDTMSNQEQVVQEPNGKRKLEKIPLKLIHIEENIRGSYPEETITELAESLKVIRLLQPITVADTENGYTILYGHRRFLAAEKIGWEEIDCIVQSGFKDEIDRITTQITENEHREDIAPADKEAAILDLEEKHELTANEICERLGKSRSWYTQIKGANKFRLQYGKLFEEAELTLFTKDAYHMREANEEQVKQTIEDLKNNGTSKTDVVSKLSNLPRQETRGRKSKKDNQVPESVSASAVEETTDVKSSGIQTGFDIGDEPLNLDISTHVVLDKDNFFTLNITGLTGKGEDVLIAKIEGAIASYLGKIGFSKR